MLFSKLSAGLGVIYCKAAKSAKENVPTPAGFEPALPKEIDECENSILVYRLNRSAKVSDTFI